MMLLICLAEILASKKKAYSDLAKKINNIKLDIDNTRQTLERFRAERDTEGVCLFNHHVFEKKKFTSCMLFVLLIFTLCKLDIIT